MANLAEHYALAVTLPCYNDTGFLPRAVKLLEQATRPEESDFVLVIAEDGSDSSDVVEKLMSEYQNILYFHNSERLGRGKAIRHVATLQGRHLSLHGR
jgi:glycosyltransferase involved in cell wall biosynthesis